MFKKTIGIILFLLLLLPLFMWLGWFFTPKKKLVIAIVDKTVLTREGQEHISLNWVLNNNRFTKTSKKGYKIDKDYFGFFPLKNKKFKIKGLERLSSTQLDQLSVDADLVYFTDTYGIYSNEWYGEGDQGSRSGMIYGGLDDKDLELLRLVKARHKTIMAEFNTIGSPTQKENRDRFEKLFGIHWTGWTGRYFDNLNPKTNPEIPKWLINNYKKEYEEEWPFTRAGVAFVNDKDAVVILEEGADLHNPLPFIYSTEEVQHNWGVPAKMKYSFWFDVMQPDLEINTVNAFYKLDLNQSGLKKLKKWGIPSKFPAVTSHLSNDYKFYYFSGDFSDNPITYNSSYFKGVAFFKPLFYDDRQPLERGSFFWKYYRPMITAILEETQEAR